MRKTAARPRYARKSFFVAPRTVARARRALGVGTDAEAVRLALERVVEMDAFWRFMAATRATLPAERFETS
jgi:Arc/MetJ family transcription regulator